MRQNKLSTKMITQIGMLGAIASVLMLFEFPIPFLAPGFYKMDLSEVPVLIGCFSMGPWAGLATELIKVLLNLVLNGTETAFVGEFANFAIGCAYILPAGFIYKKVHNRKGALLGMLAGTVIMAGMGGIINAYIMLPLYSATMFPLDKIILAGTAVNANINSLFTFVMFAVVPFNLLKGVLVSIIVFCIYKKISPILKLHH